MEHVYSAAEMHGSCDRNHRIVDMMIYGRVSFLKANLHWRCTAVVTTNRRIVDIYMAMLLLILESESSRVANKPCRRACRSRQRGGPSHRGRRPPRGQLPNRPERPDKHLGAEPAWRRRGGDVPECRASRRTDRACAKPSLRRTMVMLCAACFSSEHAS